MSQERIARRVRFSVR